MTSSGVPPGALAAIWEQHREVVLGRLDAIDRAAEPAAESQARCDGVKAAHRLAGTVGTFGITRATEMARELERQLDAAGSPNPDLSTLAGGLRSELAGGVGGQANGGEPGRRVTHPSAWPSTTIPWSWTPSNRCCPNATWRS